MSNGLWCAYVIGEDAPAVGAVVIVVGVAAVVLLLGLFGAQLGHARARVGSAHQLRQLQISEGLLGALSPGEHRGLVLGEGGVVEVRREGARLLQPAGHEPLRVLLGEGPVEGVVEPAQAVHIDRLVVRRRSLGVADDADRWQLGSKVFFRCDPPRLG